MIKSRDIDELVVKGGLIDGKTGPNRDDAERSGRDKRGVMGKLVTLS